MCRKSSSNKTRTPRVRWKEVNVIDHNTQTPQLLPVSPKEEWMTGIGHSHFSHRRVLHFSIQSKEKEWIKEIIVWCLMSISR